tara:strand:+ start:139 stop:1029 length:891 start_codon:yes stop_codon:yes gene_type:complete
MSSKDLTSIEPNLKFKKQSVENNIKIISIDGKKIPLPTEIEISESGTCNRKCVFCPRSAEGFEDKKIFIDIELVKKVSKELKELNYSGVIRFSGFVEPLLDKNIFQHIKTFKDSCERARIELVTNGDVLNLKRLKKLFSNGLSKILVSVYDSYEDAIKFEKMMKQANLNKSQYIIRHRYLPPEENFGIILSNRAGEMNSAEYKIKKLDKPLDQACFIPAYTLFFDYTGEVLICPHDWGKKLVVGNLKISKLIDIWTSKKLISVRKMLLNKKRNFSPCNLCDVNGTLMGEVNASYFK